MHNYKIMILHTHTQMYCTSLADSELADRRIMYYISLCDLRLIMLTKCCNFMISSYGYKVFIKVNDGDQHPVHSLTSPFFLCKRYYLTKLRNEPVHGTWPGFEIFMSCNDESNIDENA